MNKQELTNLILDSVSLLENILKFNHTEEELFSHVKSQLHIIHKLIPRIRKPVFDYLKNKASYKEIYRVSKLLGDHWFWLLSKYEVKTIDELSNEFDAYSLLRFLETAFFTNKARKQDPLKWWVEAFTELTSYHVGEIAWLLIASAIENKTKADETVFAYGNYKPIHGCWEDFGLDGSRTKETEKILLNYFIPPRFIKNLAKNSQDEDDIKNDYITKVLELIDSLPPEKALEMLCEGKLRRNVNTRAIDRWKDRLDGSKALKTKKREGIFQTDSLDTGSKDGEPYQVVYVDEEVQPTEESIERKIINQIIREWGFTQFPENSTNYKIMETVFENPSFTSKQIGEKLNKPSDTIKKARQRIRNLLEQHPKLF